MNWMLVGDYLLSLLTLTFLEIVLGIDNLVFIAVISSRLPPELQSKARQFGLLFAMFTRLLLLGSIFWLAHFTNPLFTIADASFSLRDLILLAGGLFLMYKATQEIHQDVTHTDLKKEYKFVKSLSAAVIQIGILDIVFSLDSVITAVGMTPYYSVMATAIIIAIAIMFFLSNSLTKFINDNPSIKMLAMSFLLMVGMVLIADGMHFHIPRPYLYFAITFSLFTEYLNAIARRKRERPERSQE